jgi:APA family basic amino acid/polyamine antiporter
VPWSPVVPLLGIAFAVYLMADLPQATWVRFAGWLVVGVLIYLLYGYRHSRVRRMQAAVDTESRAAPASTESTEPRSDGHE